MQYIIGIKDRYRIGESMSSYELMNFMLSSEVDTGLIKDSERLANKLVKVFNQNTNNKWYELMGKALQLPNSYYIIFANGEKQNVIEELIPHTNSWHEFLSYLKKLLNGGAYIIYENERAQIISYNYYKEIQKKLDDEFAVLLAQNNITWPKQTVIQSTLHGCNSTIADKSISYYLESKSTNFLNKLEKYFKSNYEIVSESRGLSSPPNVRRFNHSNPGACFQCSSCNFVFSIEYRYAGEKWLLNYCPKCGNGDMKEISIESRVASKVKSTYPKASILIYDLD